MTRFEEINNEKIEIRKQLKDENAQLNLQEVEARLNALEAEEAQLRSRQEMADKINVDAVQTREVVKPEERKSNIEVVTAFDRSDSMEYRKAFMEFVLKNKPIPAELRVESRAAATTAAGDAGAAVPTVVMNKVISKMVANGMVLPEVTRTNFNVGLSIPTATLRPVATWIAESATSDVQNNPLGSIVFTTHLLRCAIGVSFLANYQTISAFEEDLVTKMFEAMVIAVEQAIVSGSGAGQPSGIIHAAPVGTVPLGSNFSYQELILAEETLPIEYENNSIYLMHKSTFMGFVGMVDNNGQPIARVTQGINGKPERNLLGRRVVLCNYLPTYTAAASGATVGILWDFSNYVLNSTFGLDIRKYQDHYNDDLVTRALMAVDGKPVNTYGLVFLNKA